MQIALADRAVHTARLFCIAILLASAAGYMIFTIHWPWMWDDQVFHYVIFLLRHGKVAYKDIYDINMPGCYLIERWAIAIFGGGDLGWRFYEFSLLGAMAWAGAVIARRYDWLAGLFAGVIFAVLHGVDGAAMAVERDEVVTVLLFVGFAFLCLALRHSRPLLMVPLGFFLGLAILIKPTVAPYAILFLALAWIVHRTGIVRYILWSLAGFAIIAAIALAFLLPHSLGPFLFILRKEMPYYSILGHPTWSYLLKNSLPVPVALVLVVTVVLAFGDKLRAGWEFWGVRIACLLGALSYFIQRKGYTYHRYMFMGFALLWAGMELCIAMRERGWRRFFGAAAMVIAVVLILPHNVNILRHSRHDANPLADQLQADLQRLGGPALNNRVQCLDLVTGCYSALYRLGLVQSTGFMGDLQFFGPDDHNVVPYYRKIFWDDIHANPPQVIVLSSEWFGAKSYSFDKLNAWPEFRDYLNSHYTLDVTRTFGSFDSNVLAYRIYVLKDGANV